MEIKNPQQDKGGSQCFSLSSLSTNQALSLSSSSVQHAFLFFFFCFMLVVVEYYHNYSHHRFKYRIIHKFCYLFFLFNFLHITMCLKNCH